MLAMLWVGGGILVHGLAEYGLSGLEHWIHAVSEIARGALPMVGEVLAWLTVAGGGVVVGLVAGALTGIVLSSVGTPFGKAKTGMSKDG